MHLIILILSSFHIFNNQMNKNAVRDAVVFILGFYL